MSSRIIIIGSGLAGYQTAIELRRLSKDLDILLLTSDSGDFYSKPMLSNAHRSDKQVEDLVICSKDQMAIKLGISIESNVLVNGICSEKKIVYSDHNNYCFDKLVLALGARPNHHWLDFFALKSIIKKNANDIKNIFTINSLDDYRIWRKYLSGYNNPRVAIVGAGLVGVEFACDLLKMGYEVTLYANSSLILNNILDPKSSEILRQAMVLAGVDIKLDSVINWENISLEYDLVLSATGLNFSHSWLPDSLVSSSGIATDNYLETSIKDIYAIGDVACIMGCSMPYISPINSCAQALARTLIGDKTAVRLLASPILIKTHLEKFCIFKHPCVSGNFSWDYDNAVTGYTATAKGSQGYWLVLQGEHCDKKLRIMQKLMPLV